MGEAKELILNSYLWDFYPSASMGYVGYLESCLCLESHQTYQGKMKKNEPELSVHVSRKLFAALRQIEARNTLLLTAKWLP